MREYRIIEINKYTYEIEVKDTYTKGALWWKRTVEEYCTVNICGEPFGTVYNCAGTKISVLAPPLGRMITRKQAERWIRQFQGEQVIKNSFQEYTL